MSAYACVPFYRLRDYLERRPCSVTRGQDIQVVEVREDEVTAVEASTRRDKRVVLREREKRWHESVALLPALALDDFVGGASVVRPKVLGVTAVPQADVGDQTVDMKLSEQLVEDGAKLHVVVRPNAIQGVFDPIGIFVREEP